MKIQVKGKAIDKPIIKKSEIKVEIHQKPLGLQKMDRDKQRFFK